MYKNFKEIVTAAHSQGPKLMAVVCPHDSATLSALKTAEDEGLIKAILIGDQTIIKKLLRQSEMPSAVSIINETDETKAALLASRLVREGEAQLLMKGLINSAVFLKAVLDKEYGLRANKILNHLGALEIPGQERLIFFSDSGLNVAPNLATKKEILLNSLNILQKLGWLKPNVAILSHNEKVSEKVPSTFEARQLVEMAAEFPPCTIEGPMAMDVAASAQAAQHKNISSQIAGAVDFWLMPNIEAGNMVSKALIHYAKARSAGIVIGGKRPIILCSRSDSPETKLYSIALAALIPSNIQ